MACEGRVVWLLIKLHPSAVVSAGTNSSMDLHSISRSGFTQVGQGLCFQGGRCW